MSRSRRAVLAGLGAGLTGCLAPVARPGPAACPPRAGDATARVGLVGDVMLGRSVDAHWGDGPPAGVWDGLRDRLSGLEGLVGNLECCLSDRGTAADRVYTFRADPEWAVPALAAAGFDALSLANNHVLDFGPLALADTRSHLGRAGIAHPGAGPDRDAALEPGRFRAGGLDVAVIALTDRAPNYAAGDATPGTAYAALSPSELATRRTIRTTVKRALADEPDLVVASLHWGPNWETRPSETHRQLARRLIDRGVDVVHGHSAHVVQGVEVYRGRPIVYDAGDFVDDYVHKPDLHNKRSLLFALDVVDGRLTGLDLIPVHIADETVRPAGPRDAAWLREAVRERSSGFGTTYHREGPGLRVPLGTC